MAYANYYDLCKMHLNQGFSFEKNEKYGKEKKLRQSSGKYCQVNTISADKRHHDFLRSFQNRRSN